MTRSLLGHSGTCDDCGCFAHLVVDSDGRGNVFPGPQRCDDCQTRHSVYAAYRGNPELARQIYCAATPEDALRLLNIDPEKSK